MIRADSALPIEVKCPSCGETDVILLRLESRLEVTRSLNQLSLKTSSGKRDHVCHQSPLIPLAGEDAADQGGHVMTFESVG
jgi:hypothetical protein